MTIPENSEISFCLGNLDLTQHSKSVININWIPIHYVYQFFIYSIQQNTAIGFIFHIDSKTEIKISIFRS